MEPSGPIYVCTRIAFHTVKYNLEKFETGLESLHPSVQDKEYWPAVSECVWVIYEIILKG